MIRVTRASLVLALLSAGCIPEEPPPEPPPAVDPCAGLPPLALSASPTRTRVNDPVTLTATGGSGHYRYLVEPGGSSGEMRGSRFIAGLTPSKDTLVVEDLRCPGDASAQVEVVAAFDVAPARAMLKPGTSFQVQVTGQMGEPVFSLDRSDANSTVTPSGLYTAGTGTGVDLVRVRDSRTGDEALLQFEVRTDAVLRGEPALLAVPAGSSVDLATVGGSDRVIWTKVSGPGSVAAGRFLAEPGAKGAAVLEAADPFTGQKASVSVRVLDELTRDTLPHGQITDTAAVVTADFDGDGVPDVAVGRPESDLARPQGGAVLIFKGSTSGLPAQPTWVLTGETDTARFGDGLAAGDIDKDGRAELVVSSPGADVTIDGSGAVYLYRFGTSGPERIRPPLAGVGRAAFGTGLALEDVDGDGDLDLLAGSPNGDLASSGSLTNRGVVDIFQLTPGQPVPDLPTLRLGGSDQSVSGAVEQRSRTNLGQAVVVADLNGDGRADIAALGKTSRYRADNTSLGVIQPAVSVFFARAEGNRFRASPDVFVLPTNTADGNEGSWRLGTLPAEGSRPPLLVVLLDRADSPDLRSTGGLAAMTDAGGALLFDVSTYAPTGEPSATPPQQLLANAYARFYGDASSIVAGRGWALADVDGTPGVELLLGAPYATVGSGTTSLRYGGKVLVYPLKDLARGTALNKPVTFLPGVAKSDAFGVGIAPWALPGNPGLVVFAGRASAPDGRAFTGRVDGFVKAGASFAEWARTSYLVPAKPSVERFGEAVAVSRDASGAVVALVGSPGFHGPGINADGNDLSAGRAWTYGAAGGAGTLVAEGTNSPLYNGRNVGTDVAFTDFNGDGRADLVLGAPSFTVPRTASSATELGNAYQTVRTECLPTGSTDLQAGGVLVSLAQADGTYKAAYRLWAIGNITENCSGTCSRGGIGRGVVGGFDLNGDGLQDIGALRNNGFELFLGRAPDDASLARRTMGCDPVYSSPFFAQTTSVPVALGDLNGDGCHEVAWRYSDGSTRSGVAVLFGFDKGGARCGGRTTAKLVRLAADPEVGMNYLGLGLSIARVGRVLGKTGADYLAVSATNVPYNGVTQPAVMLFDTEKLKDAWLGTSGKDVVGAMEAAVQPQIVVHRTRAVGFGSALAGGVDLTGDGAPELVVSAPGASVASDGGGAVFVYAGGPNLAGALTPMLTLTGDVAERSGFGTDLALLAGSGSSPPTLVVGAPLSYRTGTQNGTAFLVPLGF
ncbi:MAG TPA: FG-GAP-like repeat-containing protein [Archangium sp.]|uniref:FG-GAP-like repeat-containing protein n=1 Tax=Archangium sp. TaxID=1872627 RepID=UPI002E32B652|nr:FG-GAP-like repeat-containing protein [Archangium sp.]HEX5753654.1 FG-GAP-like repeat-containing protein [Archangium sp.]